MNAVLLNQQSYFCFIGTKIASAWKWAISLLPFFQQTENINNLIATHQDRWRALSKKYDISLLSSKNEHLLLDRALLFWQTVDQFKQCSEKKRSWV